jgi:hypothetical protein
MCGNSGPGHSCSEWCRFLWFVNLVALLFVVSASANSVDFEVTDLSSRIQPNLFLGTTGESSLIFRSSLLGDKRLRSTEWRGLLWVPAYRINLYGYTTAHPSPESAIVATFERLFIINIRPCQVDCTRLCVYTHGCTAFQARLPK